VIPPTLSTYLLRPGLADDTRTLLRHSGEQGFEAVVLWTGALLDPWTARVADAIRPRQVAYRSNDGCAVEILPEDIGDVVASLPSDRFVLARVHTHPGAAYHSPTDDRNLLIAHPGAISVVVPDFAAAPLDLTACSVNELQPNGTWQELDPAAVALRFRTEP
jgi:hypothetical protein